MVQVLCSSLANLAAIDKSAVNSTIFKNDLMAKRGIGYSFDLELKPA